MKIHEVQEEIRGIQDKIRELEEEKSFLVREEKHLAWLGYILIELFEEGSGDAYTVISHVRNKEREVPRLNRSGADPVLLRLELNGPDSRGWWIANPGSWASGALLEWCLDRKWLVDPHIAFRRNTPWQIAYLPS